MSAVILRRCWVLPLALVVAVGIAVAGDDDSGDVLAAQNEFGQVWVNLRLTRQRLAEPYLPIVVGVLNNADQPVEITRDRVWLSDSNDIVYSMPSVKQLRKGYDRAALDRRALSTDGIPWRVWASSGMLEPSNFFPDLRARRGNNVVRDRITLRRGHGMVDLLYFETPRDLAPGKPFVLEVHPDGWEQPIRMLLRVS